MLYGRTARIGDLMVADPSQIDAMVGARVRAIRQSRKMSQTALGEKIGLSFQQIQKYERAANRISASTLFQIAQALGVTASDLFGDLEIRQNSIDWPKFEDTQGAALLDSFNRIESLELRTKVAELVELISQDNH